jgi:hypothetical protein
MATRVLVIGSMPTRAAVRFDAQRPGVIDVFNPGLGVAREVPIRVIDSICDYDVNEAASLAVENQQRWVEFTSAKTRPRKVWFGVAQ